MQVLHADLLAAALECEQFELKLVFNQRGGIFLPVRAQHRDHKAEGVSYEDDYRGNALAAMVRRGEIEVRRHRDFQSDQVRTALEALAAQPGLEAIGAWRWTYVGETIREPA